MFGLVIVILFITLEMLGLVINIPFIMIYYIRNVWPGYNYSIYYTYILYCCYCDLMNFASLHTKSDNDNTAFGDYLDKSWMYPVTNKTIVLPSTYVLIL